MVAQKRYGREPRLGYPSSTFSLALAAFLFSSPALAQEAPAPPAAQEEAASHDVSLTFSPLHLIVFPLLEVTAEFRLADAFGVAGIAGYGVVSQDVGVEEVTFDVWELGGQFRWYPIGSFEHGMQLGAQILYIGVNAKDEVAGVEVRGTASGLLTGAFLGYKIATRVGFTFDAELGYGVYAVRAEAESAAGDEASGSESGGVGILRLNIGWSF